MMARLVAISADSKNSCLGGYRRGELYGGTRRFINLAYVKRLRRFSGGTSGDHQFSHERYASIVRHVWPFDLAWGTEFPDVDQQQIAANLFASSIVPYAGFLYHLHRSKVAQKTMLIGWYYLLVFVAATIPAGIYAKVHYHTILANVDWLHGLAESNLTITNLLIVIGLRQAIRDAEMASQTQLESEEAEKEAETESLI
eukprot:jgi/Botrbrau1/9911/Bobra.0012s0012.1